MAMQKKIMSMMNTTEYIPTIKMPSPIYKKSLNLVN